MARFARNQVDLQTRTRSPTTPSQAFSRAVRPVDVNRYRRRSPDPKVFKPSAFVDEFLFRQNLSDSSATYLSGRLAASSKEFQIPFLSAAGSNGIRQRQQPDMKGQRS